MRNQLEMKRRNRNVILMEIMEHLFHSIETVPEFTLSTGTKCRVKKFSAPKTRNGELDNIQFGFDVRLEGDGSLDHVEFFVRCTGFGGQV